MTNLTCTCQADWWVEHPAHQPGCPIGDFLAGSSTLDPSAEFLAKLFHEVYERLAPEFGYMTRFSLVDGWEKLPEANRKLMIATSAEVLRKLDAVAAEPLTMLVSKRAEKIRIDFSKLIRWFELEHNEAINFALTILQHCGVPVNITLHPPPADAGNPS